MLGSKPSQCKLHRHLFLPIQHIHILHECCVKLAGLARRLPVDSECCVSTTGGEGEGGVLPKAPVPSSSTCITKATIRSTFTLHLSPKCKCKVCRGAWTTIIGKTPLCPKHMPAISRHTKRGLGNRLSQSAPKCFLHLPPHQHNWLSFPRVHASTTCSPIIQPHTNVASYKRLLTSAS